jgi:hypothetical protein
MLLDAEGLQTKIFSKSSLAKIIAELSRDESRDDKYCARIRSQCSLRVALVGWAERGEAHAVCSERSYVGRALCAFARLLAFRLFVA